jgi:predicted transcriptional regulator
MSNTSKRKVIVLPEDVAPTMKKIGLRVTEFRQKVGSNYKNFAESHNINNMTLWRIEKGEDYKMSNFLQVLNAIGTTPEDFFKGIK